MRDSFAAAFCLAVASYVSTDWTSRTTSLLLILLSRRELGGQFLAEDARRFFPGGGNADCRKVDRFQPGIAARVDAREGLEVHGDVQRHPVVGAVAAHLDAQRGDLAQALELAG